MSTEIPLDKNLEECYKLIHAKPFDFDEQADEANLLYGQQIKFFFKLRDALNELERFNDIYDKRILKRVETIFRDQIRKYQFMFC